MIKSISALFQSAQSLPLSRRIALASAIAGIIVAALVLMTPNLLFERFIVATGLPVVVDAAAPPLGVKARIVFAFVAAVATVIPVAAILLFALGRKGRDVQPSRGDDLEDEFFATMPAPRRRADSHPDAPPRPPIKAGDDLGTPLDLVDVVTREPEENSVADDAETPPVWTEEAAESGQDRWEPEAPSNDVPGHDHADSIAEPGWQEAAALETPAGSAMAEAAEIPAAPDEGGATISVAAPSLSEEERFPFDSPQSDEISDSAATEESVAAVEAGRDERPSVATEGELMALVERLEAGIERRRRRVEAANDREDSAGNIRQQPVANPERDGELQDALRDALDALQKLNASSG